MCAAFSYLSSISFVFLGSLDSRLTGIYHYHLYMGSFVDFLAVWQLELFGVYENILNPSAYFVGICFADAVYLRNTEVGAVFSQVFQRQEHLVFVGELGWSTRELLSCVLVFGDQSNHGCKRFALYPCFSSKLCVAELGYVGIHTAPSVLGGGDF